MNGNGRYRFKAADMLLPAELAPGNPFYDFKKALRHVQASIATLENPATLADITPSLGRVHGGDIIFSALDEFLIGNTQEYIWYTPGVGLLVKGDVVAMLVHPFGFDIFDEEVEGAIDGSNTGFATHARYESGTLCVMHNGVWLQEGADYAEGSATALEFNTAPQSGDVLRVNYTRSSDKARVYQETPTGTINGSNTSFTLDHAFVPGTLEVFLNGTTLQFREDFYGGTKSFEMTTAPETGDDLVVAYQVVPNTAWLYQEVPSGAINGSNTDFDTANEYAEIAVFHNGLKLSETVDYTETDGDTITLATAPSTGDTLWVVYSSDEIAPAAEPPGGSFDAWLWNQQPLVVIEGL